MGPFSYKGNEKIQYMWQEPSTFDYTGLGKFAEPGNPFLKSYDAFETTSNGGQKWTNYDNFLRSNIDNEQDNRNFDNEDGHDHLPFRTWNSEMRTRVLDPGSGQKPWATVEPGDSRLIPLIWNNPHAAELEVNIWIQQHSAGKPIVVPIRKPTCSGEGHTTSVIKFTIPSDFVELGSKIPGFKGCNIDSKPMCVLQVYAHSVESRTYASAFPIVIPGHKPGTVSTTSAIQAAQKDPWLDLTSLRDFCLPSHDPDAIIKNAVPRWARLVSDVYNHAYQNSDFSPYSGQQQESISQNLQASAINKMVTGNRGELGRRILTREATERIAQLQALEDTIYKNYEALANKIIQKIGDKHMQNSFEAFDTLGPGQVFSQNSNDGNLRVVNEHCFRCSEVSSMLPDRQTTNTYIPSFQLPQNLISQARALVPSKYSDLITSTGQVRIYVQTLLDLLPFFAVSYPYGIIYQEAMIKNTILTKPDPAKFKKRNAQGAQDYGKYASMKAKEEQAEAMGCPAKCLTEKNPMAIDGMGKPLFSGSLATKLKGECSPCKGFFDGNPNQPRFQPILTTLAGDIVKNGLSKEFASVANYPDTDGSPRIGRNPLRGEKVQIDPITQRKLHEKPKQPDWNKEVPKTTTPPMPAPDVPPEAPSPPMPAPDIPEEEAPAPATPTEMPIGAPTPPPARRRRRRAGKGGKGGKSKAELQKELDAALARIKKLEKKCKTKD